MLRSAADLEAADGRDTMPNGFLGMRQLSVSSTCTLSLIVAVHRLDLHLHSRRQRTLSHG